MIDLAVKLGPSESTVRRTWPCGCVLSYDTKEALRLAVMSGEPKAGEYEPCGLHELPQ